MKKKTASNLFRYEPYQSSSPKPRPSYSASYDLQDHNHVLRLNEAEKTLEVQGLTTYQTIVEYTLSQGFLPSVTPELKHITIGGAIVGIGIESTSFKYGFVHDGLIEAEVLLPNGKRVFCTAYNEHAALFNALPNSYGTLGYIIKAKIKIIPAKPFVQLKCIRYSHLNEYISAMQSAAYQENNDFVEGLVFNEKELLLITGQFRDKVPNPMVLTNIYKTIYYKQLLTHEDLYLTTQDYIFRYDPDWFWNIPETFIYNLFRRFAPKGWRHSGFYKNYIYYKTQLLKRLPINFKDSTEPLIQDWELPWEKAEEFLRFALKNVPTQGRPWATLPIKPQSTPTLYPVAKDQLYFNLGCYCYVNKPKVESSNTPVEDFYFTKLLDSECFALNGIKMLYSSTFIDKSRFDRIYNGSGYDNLKKLYDPENLKLSLFDKVSFK